MILIDAHNIAYTAFHALGELSDGEIRTGVTFGFLNMINRLAGQFGTDMVFCFDSKENLRKKKHPTYKENRLTLRQVEMLADGTRDSENQRAIERRAFYQQTKDLRGDVLPALGFRNVKVARGYEADDLIACYALKYKDEHKITIVSTDKDLYQLLDTNVSIFNPRTKKMFTVKDFREKYKIEPEDWVQIKAIAGDPADNIKGVWKVGEKTAIKFKRGLLSRNTKAWEQIAISWGIVLFWEKCIRLPYLGAHDIVIRYKPNRFSRIDFIKTFDRLRFVYYLRDEQFKKWEKNFDLKKEKSNVGTKKNNDKKKRTSKRIIRHDRKDRPVKKVLRKLPGSRHKKSV